jgi:6-phosphogluconolactonase
VADLGADRVFHYRFDPAEGALVAGSPPAAVSVPGSGPRQVAFSPSGAHVYAIDELSSAVSVFPWPGTEPWKPTQLVTTLPDGFHEDNSTAELALSPDGRFLYGSNRGHDSLAVYAVEEGGARLVPAGHIPAGGRTPRHFTLDSSGVWLLVAHQGSDTVAVFRRDAESGMGEQVGDAVEVSKPVCLLEVPAAS